MFVLAQVHVKDALEKVKEENEKWAKRTEKVEKWGDSVDIRGALAPASGGKLGGSLGASLGASPP